MYTVSKRPSKFAAKPRIGVPPHVDGSWGKRGSESTNNEDTSKILTDMSKPVFLQIKSKKQHTYQAQEILTPDHEEIVKFVSQHWSSVAQKSIEEPSSTRNSRAVYYKVGETNNQLKDFVPFDLDSWWGKRLFNTITKSVP